MIKRYCWKLFVLFRFYARKDQPGRIKSQQYLDVVLKQLGSQRPKILSRQSIGPDFPTPADRQNAGRDINFISIFFPISIFAERIRKKEEIESKSKT
ncbi:hypothetical protein GQ457_16G017080 [Hibiscus cannabinus]